MFNQFSHLAVANVLDSDIIVNEFELQSRCYIYFQMNTLEKNMTLL